MKQEQPSFFLTHSMNYIIAVLNVHYDTVMYIIKKNIASINVVSNVQQLNDPTNDNFLLITDI